MLTTELANAPYEVVEINKPTDIDSMEMRVKLEYLIYLKHFKTHEILLCLNFVCTDPLRTDLFNKFQVIKNKIAFKKDQVDRKISNIQI